jgi:hypothetical protein
MIEVSNHKFKTGTLFWENNAEDSPRNLYIFLERSIFKEKEINTLFNIDVMAIVRNIEKNEGTSQE